MRLLIRIVSVLAAATVLGTVWFAGAFAAAGGLRGLLATGWIGGLTIVGWLLALVFGPVAAVQLWRLRDNGRQAGVIVFGYGLAYYVIGLFELRSPEASIWQIAAAASTFAVPLAVLLLPGHTPILAAATLGLRALRACCQVFVVIRRNSA